MAKTIERRRMMIKNILLATALAAAGAGLAQQLAGPPEPLPTGIGIWTVSGGQCPLGAAAMCIPGVVFNDAPTYIPSDAANVYPDGVTPWRREPFPNEQWPRSRWIAPAVRQDGTIDCAPGGAAPPYRPCDMEFGEGVIYRYKTRWRISAGTDVRHYVLQGWFAADGRVASAYVNGQRVWVRGTYDRCERCTTADRPDSYQHGAWFTISTGFREGVNEFEVWVENGSLESGLRVGFTRVGVVR